MHLRLGARTNNNHASKTIMTKELQSKNYKRAIDLVCPAK
jgi:hypothetical protein